MLMFACANLLLLAMCVGHVAQQSAAVPRGEQDKLISLLSQGEYPAVAKLLLADKRRSLIAFGSGGAALIRLRPAGLRAVLKSLSSIRAGQAQGLAEKQLRTLLLSHRGDPLPAYRAFVSFLDHADLRQAVLPHVGRGAMQLCRFGDPAGLSVLEKILEIHRGQAWAMSNLANALRFLGRYKDAMSLWEGLLAGHGRTTWTMNNLGLCHQAQGRSAKALELYLRGIQPESPGPTSDKDTCRCNAALLLWQTGRAQDRAKARELFDAVKDPGATRAKYWQRQLVREEERQSSHR